MTAALSGPGAAWPVGPLRPPCPGQPEAGSAGGRATPGAGPPWDISRSLLLAEELHRSG